MQADTPQPSTQSRLTGRLTHVRRALCRRSIVIASVGALGLLCGGAMLLDGWNRLFLLREHAAFWLLALLVVAAVTLLVWNWFLAVFRAPSAVDVALDVERGHPEFMDSLVCAAELSARPRDSLRPLERALLEKVETDIRGGSRVEDVFRERLSWRRLVAPALLLSCAAAVLLHSRPVVKARFFASDLVRGERTGLTVHGPSAPVPVHSDVTVRADIHRWQDEAHIAFEDAEGNQRFVMNRQGARRYFFTFYDVAGPLRYRVETPSLTSGWQTLETYAPPAFEGVEIRLTSPPYTGREALVFGDFRNGTVVEGGTLRVAVRPDLRAQALLFTGEAEGTAHPMVADRDGWFVFEQSVTETVSFAVELTTPEGWKTRGPDTTVSVEPDLPPVVDIVRPREDVQVKLNENVELDIRAGDDFGVRNIVLDFSVSGGPRQAIRLFAPGTERVTDPSIAHLWDLAELKVREGDVISYAAVVTDNRQPNPQQARTDVHFIVVRPDVQPKESEGDGQQKELDISGIIAEVKRLIRYAWDALSIPDESQAEMAAALTRDLKDVRIDLRRTYNEAAEAAGGMMQGDIPMFFQAADEELGQAAALAERVLLEESLPPQERALANLISLENELLKNAAKGKGKSSSTQQSDNEPGEQDQQESQSQAEARQKAIEAIKKALEQARDLSERQDNLNREMQREQHSRDAQIGQALADKQNQVRNDAETLAKTLEKIQEAQRAARDLQAADREMKRAEGQLQKTEISAGKRHGARAYNFLLASIQSLEDGLRRASATEIQRLAQAANELADRQRQESGNSRELEQMASPPEQQVDAARERQDALREQAEALQNAIASTAGDLEQDFPRAAEALIQAERAAREAGLARTMKRAANALLYGRFGRARQEQVDAANALQGLAAELEGASRFLPTMSREELLEAIRRMRENTREAAELMEQTAQTSPQQVEKLRERAATDLDRLAAQTSDAHLQDLADSMSLPMGGENPAAAARRLAGMFNAAIQVLEKHLMAAELKRRVGLSRQNATPPEKYRRLVEEYFKDLSREQ